MKTWIGTSGFQYPEWKGKFYPDDLSVAKMLPYYAERFPTTEINYSFRRIPSEKTMANWAKLTPDSFRFSLKAPQKITHFAKLKNQTKAAEYFAGEVAKLGEKLGIVLYQLPPSFPVDIAVLEDFLSGLPKTPRVAFEFRHESWFNEKVFTLLQQHRAALCVAENETLQTPMIATAAYGYLRLRREDYTAKDLQRWAKAINEKGAGWKEVFVYFKHEERGVGPEFAARMQKILT